MFESEFMDNITKSWSDGLPEELLVIIGKFLNTKTDVSRFRAVCKSWRSSTPPFKNPVPLSLSCKFKSDFNKNHLVIHLNLPVTKTILYHVAPKNTDNNNSKSSLSSSSSWGWLLKLQETGQHGGSLVPVDPNFDLYCNAYSNFPKVFNALDFRVSELSKSYTYNIDKHKFRVVFPSSLDCPNSMVEVHDFRVEFYMKNDYSYWVYTNSFDCVDFVSYGGKFCLVQEDGRALTIDYSLKEKSEIVSPLSIQDDHDHSDHEKHLVVDLDAELLLVDVCFCANNNMKPNKKLKKLKYVKVFKLNAKEKKWVEMESLEGRLLFVGFDYSSFSVFATDFPGCKGNCICIQYFHDQAAVFDLIAGCFLPSKDLDYYTNIFLPPWSRSKQGTDRFNGQQLLPEKEELLLST